MLARIALVTDDADLRRRLHLVLEGPDSVVTTTDPSDWLQRIPRLDCDLVIASAAALPAEPAEAVDALRLLPGNPELVVVSTEDDAEETGRLLAAGCLAVVSPEVPDDAFRETFDTLIQKRREAAQLVRDAEEVAEDDRFGDYVSKSPHTRTFLKLARKLAQSDSTVLILGETGVGKERLARAIHAEGRRAEGPFIVVNCGAIPEALLESELFGHEKGAFTGAVRAHRGHFELAHRGTIFLDEIGELPLHLQVKLLRVIQEKTIQRIGGEAPLQVDVRIMAATNRDLLVEMEEKRFRPDLYYRLSVVALEVPPLRERRDDIPALVQSYFEQFRTQMPTSAERVSDAAMRALQSYDWPGNIRELVNVVERSVLLAEGREIVPEDFPETIVPCPATEPPTQLPSKIEHELEQLDETWLDRPLAESRRAWAAAFERSYLTGLLRLSHGRINETAARAGIDPRSLYTKMKQHGLRKEDFR